MPALNNISPTLNDDTAAASNVARIQALIDAGGDCELLGSGIVWINDTLLVGDYTQLRIPRGMTLKQVAGTNKTLIANKASRLTPKQITSLTSSGNVCTAVCTAHGLAVDEYVSIEWAATLGYQGVFRVKSVADADTFTFVADSRPAATPAVAASDAASGIGSAGAFIQCRKANVNACLLVEGVVDYDQANNAGASNLNLMAIHWGHFAHGRVDVPGVIKNAKKYAVLAHSFRGFDSSGIHVSTASDGLHITGPAIHANVAFVDGYVGDNIYAQGTGDYSTYLCSEGEIRDVRIDRIGLEGQEVVGARFFGAAAYPNDVDVGTIFGSTTTTKNLADFLRDPSVLPDGNAWIRRARIGLIAGDPGSASSLYITATTVDDAEVGVRIATDAGTPILIGVSGTATTVRRFKANLELANTSFAGSCVKINTSSAVDTLVVSGIARKTTTTGAIVEKAGTGNRLCIFEDFHSRGFNSIYRSVNGATGDTEVSFNGIYVEAPLYLAQHSQASGDLNVTLNGGRYDVATSVLHHSGTGGTLRGKGHASFISSPAHLTRSASQGLEAYSDDIHTDVSTLAITAAQRCWNTNAALGTLAAAGIVHSDGASWRQQADPTLLYTP